MKYIATIPAWTIEIEANSFEEAYEIAEYRYDDHKDQDPEFDKITIKKVI